MEEKKEKNKSLYDDRETVGKISQELLLKETEALNPMEYEREIDKKYFGELFKCIAEHKDKFRTSFYITVLTKKERLMENVLRYYFIARRSCPTPDYDQAVWKYHYDKMDLEFLWVIPSKDTCILLLANKQIVAPEEWGLLNFVLRFEDGSLYRLCKQLNKEKEVGTSVLA